MTSSNGKRVSGLARALWDCFLGFYRFCSMASRWLSLMAENKKTALTLAFFTLCMGGVAFYAPTLYDAFCRITGYGGTPMVVAESSVASSVSQQRSFNVHFEADISDDLHWQFEPAQGSVTLDAGEVLVVHYKAQNMTDHDTIGTAVYNVTPHKIAPYVAKVDCFCFQEQPLGGSESAMMPIRFTIDPAVMDDPSVRDVTDVTFSYIFYPSDQQAVMDHSEGGMMMNHDSNM